MHLTASLTSTLALYLKFFCMSSATEIVHSFALLISLLVAPLVLTLKVIRELWS